DVVLGVFELDRDAQLLRPLLHAGADRGQEVVIEQSHGDAQRGRVRGRGQRRQYAGEQRQTNALHPRILAGSLSVRQAGCDRRATIPAAFGLRCESRRATAAAAESNKLCTRREMQLTRRAPTYAQIAIVIAVFPGPKTAAASQQTAPRI